MRQVIFLLVFVLLSSCAMTQKSLANSYLKKAESLNEYCLANGIEGDDVNDARSLIEEANVLLQLSPKGDDQSWTKAELASVLLTKAISEKELEDAVNDLKAQKKELESEQKTLKAYQKTLADVKRARGVK